MISAAAHQRNIPVEAGIQWKRCNSVPAWPSEAPAAEPQRSRHTHNIATTSAEPVSNRAFSPPRPPPNKTGPPSPSCWCQRQRRWSGRLCHGLAGAGLPLPFRPGPFASRHPELGCDMKGLRSAKSLRSLADEGTPREGELACGFGVGMGRKGRYSAVSLLNRFPRAPASRLLHSSTPLRAGARCC